MFMTVRYFSYPLDLKLDSVDLRHKREELEKLYARVESFRACTFHIVDEDWGFLSEDDYYAIDAADDRLLKMEDYLEEAIESIDNALEALSTLESSIYFVYDEVEEFVKVKKGVA